jgi:hypothetical protein
MYHQSASDAHPRPLRPVVIRPEHYVPEIEEDADAFVRRSRRVQRRAAGFLGYNVHLGSRMLVRGALLMTLAGGLMLVPLIAGDQMFFETISRLGEVVDSGVVVRRETTLEEARPRVQ